VAIKPHDASPVRSYPDHPHPGTTVRRGGAKSAVTWKETEIPIRIVRIDTIPMTDDQLDNAAEALAVLLNHFWHDHANLAA
jgi:hypothetical protein